MPPGGSYSWVRLRREFDEALTDYLDALGEVRSTVDILPRTPRPEEIEALLRARIREADARERYSAAAKALFRVALKDRP